MYSLNCLHKRIVCEYAPPRLFLRDRRAQRKTPQPWQQSVLLLPPQTPSSTSECPLPPVTTSWQVPLGTALDPFDTLAIKMPFKSRELIHYCKCTSLDPQKFKNGPDWIALVFEAERDSAITPITQNKLSPMYVLCLESTRMSFG